MERKWQWPILSKLLSKTVSASIEKARNSPESVLYRYISETRASKTLLKFVTTGLIFTLRNLIKNAINPNWRLKCGRTDMLKIVALPHNSINWAMSKLRTQDQVALREHLLLSPGSEHLSGPSRHSHWRRVARYRMNLQEHNLYYYILSTGLWVRTQPQTFLDDMKTLHHRVQNGSGAHPASCTMGTRGSFLGGKAAGAWNWPLTAI
jgi:hypothetical protein